MASATATGRWVTIHGSPVFIEDGEITKGPKALVGKSPADVSGHSDAVSHEDFDAEVNPRQIETPNQITDREKFDALVANMKENGWTGRPALVEREGDQYQAWTASHRILAAKKAEVDVPVVIIDRDKIEAFLEEEGGDTADTLWKNEGAARDDADRIDLLKKVDLRAARLMQAEVHANDAADKAGRKFLSKTLMTTAPIYLHAASDGAKPAVTLGQGLPAERNGLPAFYFWRPVIADGEYVHPVKGFKLSVDSARRKTWEANFRRMRDAGEVVPVVKDHADDKSDATLGYVVDARQNGAWYEELHQYLGPEARDVALRNQISVGIDPDYQTGHGVKFGDCIVHSATTPRPVVPGQGQAVPYAAARAAGVSADVLELSAAPTQQESTMDLSALRKAVGAADTVPEADVLSQACAKLGEIPALTSAKTTAETDLASVRQELSRRPAAQPEGEFPAAIATGSFNLLSREIELMAREGDITSEQAAAAKVLLGTAQKPNTMALSRTGTDHPAEAWLKVLALGKSGIKAENAKTPVQELSRKTADDTPDRQAELLKKQIKGYDLPVKVA